MKKVPLLEEARALGPRWKSPRWKEVEPSLKEAARGLTGGSKSLRWKKLEA
jgi:hypothetical protein